MIGGSLGFAIVPRRGRRRALSAGPPLGARGYGLLELLLVMIVIAIMTAVALPRTTAYVREQRVRGAAVYLRSLLRQVRARAAAEARYIGLVFEEADRDPVFTIYADGNGNGIRRADIAAGTEIRLREPYKLSEKFPGVRYGSLPTGASMPFFPGLQIGASKIVSFSPLGSCTTGSVFLSNESGVVYAIVILGATGRVRIARYADGRWQAI
ncbi:MAG TPA: prepilin-type N-terminal cleavage/methylation domain-containing protein [Vicinamibacteria bacterium]|nr:prepilin-type N-terminal cleavage/methylation domain-containing protein [Vicinamibacteria bacterium]